MVGPHPSQRAVRYPQRRHSRLTRKKTNLLGIRVGDCLLLNPALGFLIIRVIDFLRGVNRRLKVLKETSSLVTLAVDEYIISVIRAAK